jgi:hypothetical protein
MMVDSLPSYRCVKIFAQWEAWWTLLIWTCYAGKALDPMSSLGIELQSYQWQFSDRPVSAIIGRN